MEINTIILLGIVILLTHFLEGITGFGCTIIAIPFAIILVGIEVGRPVLTIAAFLLCFSIMIKDWKHIDFRRLLRILIFMGIGLPIGMLVYNYLPELTLKRTLAIFMILVSIRGLTIFFFKRGNNLPSEEKNTFVKSLILHFLLVIGGIVHGAFTSGGPLAVVYATEKIKDKSVFRATLCAMWSILNAVLLIQMLFSKSLTAEVLQTFLWTLPFLIAGTVFGNAAHYKIKDRFFTSISYGILLISSAFMFI